MMFELDPPGQQPIMMMTMACTGSTPKAKDSAKAVKGMMPNWQRKPMTMPQGFLMWLHSFSASTVQPMANMTKASITVSTVLNTRLRTALKLLGGMRQFAPEQTVARESQDISTTDVFIVNNKMEGEDSILRFHKMIPMCPSVLVQRSDGDSGGGSVLLSALYAHT
ncbi:hypothetical protein CHARACLAT_031134, partial [Characodon lateralis]|nr:hypothetical protein [Characodon lateralis]